MTYLENYLNSREIKYQKLCQDVQQEFNILKPRHKQLSVSDILSKSLLLELFWKNKILY